MSKHTPEPWKFWGDKEAIVMDKPLHSKHGFIAIMACNEDVSARTSSDNARRIVACVNACRGLGTDELEQHGLVSAVGYELIELTKQRDELLEAAKAVVTRWDTPNWKDAEPTAAVIGRLRAILQKIEGCEE